MARQKGFYVTPGSNRSAGDVKERKSNQHLNGSAVAGDEDADSLEGDTAFTQFFNSTFVRIALFVSVAVILLTAGTVKSLDGDVVVAVSLVAKCSLAVVFSAYRYVWTP